MDKKIIINADDFGLSYGVSDGILKAHQEGIVTSTSLMTNQIDSVRALIEGLKYPNLGIGVHLVITKGSPISNQNDVCSLVDSTGEFYNQNELYKRRGKIEINEIYIEYCNQIERFFRISGRLPNHLNTHHFIGNIYPPFFKILLKVAEKYNLPIRFPKFEERLFDINELTYLLGGIPVEKLRKYQEENYNLLKNSKVIYPDNFIPGFFGINKITKENLLSILDSSDQLTEIMVHPGFIDKYLTKISTYTDERKKELNVLISREIKEYVKSNRVNLINQEFLIHNSIQI
ncbi:ChbG/HpnK family deacetylase [Halalkalibacter sp. APA_J-10(15)]|uniref:ChbG/HpnK family deacetylase n=1 Tax=Halalkalibacter sp. APA_J-10(15) TaxID=2933805 RepID=UPI001FF39E66|nr:ChbG/HpnK family deacetylase [Halalkalibacter sp. APA_J-10(15)]MCK0473046.1 ChbG/HpnK family deacetylase [Halalkalibacter sp. APA_J-10(15)]